MDDHEARVRALAESAREGFRIQKQHWMNLIPPNVRPRPTPEQLTYVVMQLTRYIPSPPTPRPVVQASKWGRKVGDLLTRNDSHAQFEILATDSLGVTLKETRIGEVIRVEHRDQFAVYTKVRTRRPKKVAVVGRDEPLPLGNGGAK